MVTLIARAVLATRMTYLHPDEHLQGPQIMANGLFGWAAQIPWEFRDTSPIRSFVPLWLQYGIPMSVFSDYMNPMKALLFLRLTSAAITFILEDMAVDRLASNKSDKLQSLIFLNTSYVTLTWQSHTFSNSLETILVLWYIVILDEFEKRRRSQTGFDRGYDSLLLGSLVALGIFNRPTFPAFLLLPSLNLVRFFWHHKLNGIGFGLSILLVSSIFVAFDSSIYSGSSWVIAPLNNLRFNSVAYNLEEHGIHPRVTHLLVNLPQLLGPGLLVVSPRWKSLAMQSVISGLVILSCSPHQEARFLLPLVPLLCTQMDIGQFRSLRLRRVILAMWFIFNALAAILMGLFHQGGVIPAQQFVRNLPRPCTVIWWKTYTPPLWITGLPQGSVQYAELSPRENTLATINDILQNPKTDLTIVDFLGAPEKTIIQAIRHASGPVYFVAPMANRLPGLGDELWFTPFHVSLEHIDWGNLPNFHFGLALWNVTSSLM